MALKEKIPTFKNLRKTNESIIKTARAMTPIKKQIQESNEQKMCINLHMQSTLKDVESLHKNKTVIKWRHMLEKKKALKNYKNLKENQLTFLGDKSFITETASSVAVIFCLNIPYFSINFWV